MQPLVLFPAILSDLETQRQTKNLLNNFVN